MAKVQKVYTREFKEEAVRLAQTSGKPIAQVARELGISDTSIHQWRKELTQHGKEAFPGSGHQTPLVVGWAMSACCDEVLVESALVMALSRRRPQAGLLHHSDRGSQYTSHAYRGQLERLGMVVSMSRKGNCWDNAVMESFFGLLKEECAGNTVYPSHEHARSGLFEYLEVHYNRQRRHSSLGYVSPLTYEQMAKERAESTIDVLRLS